MNRSTFFAAIVFVACSHVSSGAVVDERSEPLRHPYQVSADGVCNGESSQECFLTFPAVSVRTLVTKVSCDFQSSGDHVDAAQFINFDKAATPPVVAREALQPFIYGVWNGLTEFGLSSDPYMFFEPGQIPQLYVEAYNQTLQSIECRVSGYQ